jgi:hypothetical protein
MFTSRIRVGSAIALWGICAVAFVVWAPTSVWAAEGRCLIAVEGHTYLKGGCNISMEAGGSFKVGVGEESRSKYFAYVMLDTDPGNGHGYWNGVEAEDHAHKDLGLLKRKGACWSNARAKVCAWRQK